jgi:hypothetical protein
MRDSKVLRQSAMVMRKFLARHKIKRDSYGKLLNRALKCMKESFKAKHQNKMRYGN